MAIINIVKDIVKKKKKIDKNHEHTGNIKREMRIISKS